MFYLLKLQIKFIYKNLSIIDDGGKLMLLSQRLKDDYYTDVDLPIPIQNFMNGGRGRNILKIQLIGIILPDVVK